MQSKPSLLHSIPALFIIKTPSVPNHLRSQAQPPGPAPVEVSLPLWGAAAHPASSTGAKDVLGTREGQTTDLHLVLFLVAILNPDF